jgi:uncharacterized protein
MKTRVALLLLMLAACGWYVHRTGIPRGDEVRELWITAACGRAGYCHHFDDRARLFSAGDRTNFELYLSRILSESDIDIRFVFVSASADETLESLAVDLVESQGIGRETGGERGVLLLYDPDSRRLKVEVGYGLEAYFPDVFVHYLVDQHARAFFDSGDLTLGLRLLLRLLQHRIREAVLGEDFDPAVVNVLPAGHLSGGAGVAADMSRPSTAPRSTWSDGERERYRAAADPAATYQTYMRWIAQPLRDPKADFLTASSRSYVAHLPVSPAYAHFILMGEYGKRFEIVERDDRAILYFTNTPLVAPHFFRREGDVWRMDILSEVQRTREFVGGFYNWMYANAEDPYTQAFADLLVPVAKGWSRFKKGDNRVLKTAKR